MSPATSLSLETQHGAIGTYVDRQATTALCANDTLGSSRPVYWVPAQAAFGAMRLSPEEPTLSKLLNQALKANLLSSGSFAPDSTPGLSWTASTARHAPRHAVVPRPGLQDEEGRNVNFSIPFHGTLSGAKGSLERISSTRRLLCAQSISDRPLSA